MPNDAAEPTVYAIVQMPEVQNRLTRDHVASELLMPLIFGLQSNPRPDGYKAAEEFGRGIFRVLCEDTTPTCEIVYRVDEEDRRVVVLAITELRWRDG
jgi:hypothetical protein